MSWVQRAPNTSPPARRSHALVFESARGRVVLFGGTGSTGAELSDTWEWDGTDWLQRTPLTSPPARYGHTLAYDSARGRVVLFGGNWFGSVSDTWEWDGTNWLRRAPSTSPGLRYQHALAYDTARSRLVLFGGSGSLAVSLSDTWEYFAPCDVVGPGHPGGGLPIACISPPRIGSTFCVSFSHPPPVGAGFHLLLVGSAPPLNPPLVLDPPGVCARAFLHLLPQLIVSTVGDAASFCVALPAGPALIGKALCIQGASLEVGVCFRATDALAVVIQP
jgi:hypothetical protein